MPTNHSTMASLRRLIAAGLGGHRGNLHGSQGLRSVRVGDPGSLTRRIVLSVLRRWQFPLVKEEWKVITDTLDTPQQQQQQQTATHAAAPGHGMAHVCEDQPTGESEHSMIMYHSVVDDEPGSCQLTTI